MPHTLSEVKNAYSTWATEYTKLVGTMDAVHPSDRQLIESWAATIEGTVLDAGCGPGHWTGYLQSLGVDAYGIDTVPSFIEIARSAHPDVAFELGSIEQLDADDASHGGVLSWFSTIHYLPDAIPKPIAEFARVLEPGAGFVMGFFEGPSTEAFDHRVTRAYRWRIAELQVLLADAGFEVLETHTRAELGRRPVGAVVAQRL